MNGTNAETLEEVRCEIIGTTFTGRIILDCHRGRIEDVYVRTPHTPPWKRREKAQRQVGRAPELTASPQRPNYDEDDE